MSLIVTPKNTLDAYAADWKHFSGWCDNHKRRALPASPETILCYDDLSGSRDKAILLIGFAGAFRRSEIVGLQFSDIQIGDAGLIITLRRSKTDQEGASFTKGIPIGTSDVTCPKCALEAWLQLAGITTKCS